MSSTKFRVNVLGTDQVVVRLTGAITESSEVGQIRIPDYVPVEFDLVGLTGINSMGLRLLRDWLSGFQNPSLEFSFCPKFFIDQVNMVQGLLPAHARIVSFYVPYYSEVLGEEKSALLTRDKDFHIEDGEVIVEWPSLQDSDGREMLIDINPDRFLAFLKKH